MEVSTGSLSLCIPFPQSFCRAREAPGVHCDTLGNIIGLVNANQSICHFKHIIPQTDDDELGILGPFLCK